MKFALFTDAVLVCDVPEHRLKRGDIVKLVDHPMLHPTVPKAIPSRSSMPSATSSLSRPSRPPPSNLSAKTKFSAHGR